MKTRLLLVTGVALLGALALTPGCNERGYLGKAVPDAPGTGGDVSAAINGGVAGGAGGPAAASLPPVGSAGSGPGGVPGFVGWAVGSGGLGGDFGSGGLGGVGGWDSGSGGLGGLGGWDFGSGGLGGFVGSGGFVGGGGGAIGSGGFVGGGGGAIGSGGFVGGTGGGSGIQACPAAAASATPTDETAFHTALTRKWLRCLYTTLGGEAGDALGVSGVGIEIKSDGRYWHLKRDASGKLVGITGVDSEGSIAYGQPDSFGAREITIRSDLNQELTTAPVITANNPAMLIVKTSTSDHRFVAADGP